MRYGLKNGVKNKGRVTGIVAHYQNQFQCTLLICSYELLLPCIGWITGKRKKKRVKESKIAKKTKQNKRKHMK